MSDYIDKSNLYKSIADREEEYRSALLKEKDYNTATALQLQGLLNSTTLIKHLVFDYPTVEAEPVRYGRWQVNEVDGYKDMTCLSCGWLYEYYDGLEEEWNYCPHCGALQSFAIATEKEIEMPRYIDADKIADFVCSVCGDICDDEFKNRGCIERQFIEECVKKMPTADAVEVVRCKDCKNYGTEVGGVPTKGYCKKTEFMTKNENDFCSWGEKR